MAEEKVKDSAVEIETLLRDGVVDFVDPGETLKKKLLEKARGTYTKDIIIKLGADPNRPDIHLGHAVILRKLRKFQDAGCKVVFVVGDYTASIGDPSGKNKVRVEVAEKEIQENMNTYVAQVGKLLKTDPSVFSWIRNSDWFYGITDLIFDEKTKVGIDFRQGAETKHVPVEPNSFIGKALLYENTRMQKTSLGRKETATITLKGLLWTLRHITHARLIERDMFRVRIQKGEELYMHEMLYPVLQGIDSSVISLIYGSCDLEIGGTDQTFNMLIGRDVLRANKQPEQAVMTMPLLLGTDGKEKMSKSLDNYIGITDEPNNMYGKIMSIPDALIVSYFRLCTYETSGQIAEIEGAMTQGKNPKDLKMKLAREIVALYHGEKKSHEAETNFTNTFSKGGVSEDALAVEVSKGTALSDVALEHELVSSKSEWRRLIDEGAVRNMETDQKIENYDFKIDTGLVVKIGKRRFLKIGIKT
ncbi:MAG TPA: tyrosine--tRNA ligase [Candidatus Paceibacterota bacterium]